MTGTPSECDHVPIYEDMVRERGDVVAEAQTAAEHTRNQAAKLLGRQHADQQANLPTGYQVLTEPALSGAHHRPDVE
ncbi:hypothetical protein ACWKT3_00345 [Streptomyces violaceus]